MPEIIYSKEEEKQSLDLRFIFKVKMSPGNKHHLSTVLEHYFKSKGVLMEDESHIIQII